MIGKALILSKTQVAAGNKVYNPAMPQLYPYTGNQVDVNGIIIVYYFGRPVAFVNQYGEFYWRDEQIPTYFIEYLLQQPDRLKDIRRN